MNSTARQPTGETLTVCLEQFSADAMLGIEHRTRTLREMTVNQRR